MYDVRGGNAMQSNPSGVDLGAGRGRDAQTGMSLPHSKRPECQPVLGPCGYICCGVGPCELLLLLLLLLLLMMIGA